jgi:hypothetical protein
MWESSSRADTAAASELVRRRSDSTRALGGGRLQLFPLLHHAEELILAVAPALLQVLDLTLQRLELLRVDDAPVVEPPLLGRRLLREAVDLVLDPQLLASDRVELQAELPQRVLGAVGLEAGSIGLGAGREHVAARPQPAGGRVDLLEFQQTFRALHRSEG